MSEIINSYESVLVVEAKLSEEEIAALVEKFKTLIENNGELVSVDEWGKRRLAYEINKQNEGYYVLYTFNSTAAFPAELDRVYKITEGVLRSMIIRKDA